MEKLDTFLGFRTHPTLCLSVVCSLATSQVSDTISLNCPSSSMSCDFLVTYHKWSTKGSLLNKMPSSIHQKASQNVSIVVIMEVLRVSNDKHLISVRDLTNFLLRGLMAHAQHIILHALLWYRRNFTPRGVMQSRISETDISHMRSIKGH